MKKKIGILILGLFVILLTACSFGSTPTSSVEKLLNKYINNDEEIVVELDDYVSDTDLKDDQIKKYKDLYLKQFKDMKYEIKDEKVDGDTATVTAQITVYDFYKVETDANEYLTSNPDKFKTDDTYDKSKFIDYKLDLLNKVEDKIDYTIDFTLTKVDNNWEVNELTTEQLEKIHGVFKY